MFRSTLVVLASTSAILISIPARAAYLPSPVQPVAPVAYPPSFSWTGFYVGGELGWIGTNPEYTTGAVLLGTPFVVSAATGKDGMSYGVLAGYNYQVGNVVLGIEGDFEGWTVGKIRYSAITGDFLTAHSKWGGFGPWPPRLCCRPRAPHISGGERSSQPRRPFRLPVSRSAATIRASVGPWSRPRLCLHEQLVHGSRVSVFEFQSKNLDLSHSRPKSRDDCIEARPEQQPDYGSVRL